MAGSNERRLGDRLERQTSFSPEGYALRNEWQILADMGAFEHLDEIQAYIREVDTNAKPFREVLVSAGPLHFDEVNFLRVKFRKSYSPHEFDYVKKPKEREEPSFILLTLTYNRAVPQVVRGREEEPIIIRDNEDELFIASFPGAGIHLGHNATRAGVEAFTGGYNITHEEMKADPNLLPDALWSVVWNNPPIKNNL